VASKHTDSVNVFHNEDDVVDDNDDDDDVFFGFPLPDANIVFCCAFAFAV
jgi:hypothetical protein